MQFLILILLNIILTNSLTPLSECTQGRITGYDEYEDGGSCGFVPPKLYGAAPNEKFYNNGEKCGICYELIGPNGILYFMVDSYCPVKGNEKSCSGDMFHFDLHRNAFLTIADRETGRLNVTFRMVACNHEGNIIIKTKKEVSEYYYEFVVINHKIGLKKVYYSFDKKDWVGLERQGDYNHWRIDRISQLPFYLQFESISGEKIMTQINEIKKDFKHDTGVQFSVPKDMYFSVDTLKKISGPKKERCCKLNDCSTNIYDEGKFLGEWEDTSNCQNKNIEFNSGCLNGSKKCIKVEMVDWSCFQFRNRIKVETKRYKALEFYIKSEKECNNCLGIKKTDGNFFKISTKTPGIWEKIIINFSDLGLTDEKFQNFLFQGSIKSSQIFYFDDIKLVKSEYVDNGLCYESDSGDDNNGSSNNNNNDKTNENGSSFSEPSSGGTTALIVSISIIIVIAIIIGIFWFLRYKSRKNLKNDIEEISKDTKLI